MGRGAGAPAGLWSVRNYCAFHRGLRRVLLLSDAGRRSERGGVCRPGALPCCVVWPLAGLSRCQDTVSDAVRFAGPGGGGWARVAVLVTLCAPQFCRDERSCNPTRSDLKETVAQKVPSTRTGLIYHKTLFKSSL
ncbi:hypothetical protein AOLI_G00315180 [Acnodon oligacanthus]